MKFKRRNFRSAAEALHLPIESQQNLSTISTLGILSILQGYQMHQSLFNWPAHKAALKLSIKPLEKAALFLNQLLQTAESASSSSFDSERESS